MDSFTLDLCDIGDSSVYFENMELNDDVYICADNIEIHGIVSNVATVDLEAQSWIVLEIFTYFTGDIEIIFSDFSYISGEVSNYF